MPVRNMRAKPARIIGLPYAMAASVMIAEHRKHTMRTVASVCSSDSLVCMFIVCIGYAALFFAAHLHPVVLTVGVVRFVDGVCHAGCP